MRFSTVILTLGIISWCLFKTGSPKKLNILSGEGQGIRKDSPMSVITNAFDGEEGTELKNCYSSEKGKPKEARFKINTAEVTNVHLLGRSDKKLDWNMVDTVVEVCIGETNCKLCGRVTKTPARGVYADVQCAECTKGDTILVRSEARPNYLQICEINVFGYEAGNQIKLNILSGEGQGIRKDSPMSVITNAYDGEEGTELKNCYSSEKGKPKEARFKINPARVTNVNLLGRSDKKLGWNMVDTVVEVCIGDTNCKLCGRVTKTPVRGVYADVQCVECTKGDTIVVRSEARPNYLQICEINVFGYED